MNINIDWLEPWDSLCVNTEYFEKQLYKEVGKTHILYGKQVKAIGRKYDCDDYLFRVTDTEFTYAVVHLTYSTNNNSPNYPRTRVYKDLNDWINNCMKPDHDLYM